MLRLTICYGHPRDAAVFDRHYDEIHRPLAEKLPGLRQLALGDCRPISDADGVPYHLVAELSFDTSEDLATALASGKGQAAAGDLKNFAEGGVTLFVQHDRPQSAGPEPMIRAPLRCHASHRGGPGVTPPSPDVPRYLP